MYVYLCICVYVYVDVFALCVCVYRCTHLKICACVCVCAYIHTNLFVGLNQLKTLIFYMFGLEERRTDRDKPTEDCLERPDEGSRGLRTFGFRAAGV